MINTENKIYTRNEMRRLNILTEEYVFIGEPEEVVATLDMKAEARSGMLRLFFSFSDGRKIITPVFWWQQYLGFYEIPVGTTLRLTYGEGKNGLYSLKKAEPV